MPTARELLEQADALMRRNRERAEAERLAKAQAESVALERPDLVEAELEVAPADGERRDDARREDVRDEDIPELTDAVALEVAPVIDLRPAVSALDDVPELTDAVEEIEAPSILELPADEGEPSQWLEVDRGEVSVTGAAPDSVVALPASVPHPATNDEARAFAPATAPAETPDAAPGGGPAVSPSAAYVGSTFTAGTSVFGPGDVRRGDADAAANESVADIDAARGIAAETGTAGETVVATPPDAVVERAEALGEEAPPIAAAALGAPGPAWLEGAPADVGTLDEPAAPVYAVEILESPALPAAPDVAALQAVGAPAAEPGPAITTPGDTIAAAPDALHWDVLAEEIRMQVLQRIDIFTDTGLQEQLAARVQPIVDRASAELVVTINREVGRLLRAYVAEAIEREIEKWRQEGG